MSWWVAKEERTGKEEESEETNETTSGQIKMILLFQAQDRENGTSTVSEVACSM